MTVADLEALIGPPAPDRIRTVMGPRGPQPPEVHSDYRAWLASPPPPMLTAQPVDPVISAVAVLCGLLVLLGAILVAVAVLS